MSQFARTRNKLAGPEIWNRAHDYVVAVLVAILTLTSRAALAQIIENDYLYVLQLLGVVFVSWRGGFAPGITNLMICGIGMLFIFLLPRHPEHRLGFGDVVATAMFFFCGVCCAALGEAQWSARRRARDALNVALERKAELEVEVARRREADNALRESEEQFRRMADSVPVLIWVSNDRNPERKYFNKTWLEFTGRTLQQEIGVGWTENIHPDDCDRYLKLYTDAFAASKPFELEYRLRRHDGEYRWVLARGTPRFAPGGQFAGFSGLCLDVTDRKRAEEAVRRSERNLTDFFENANVGLHWGAEDGTILRANRAELEMLGYGSDEYVGRTIFSFHTESEAIEEIYARLKSGGRVDNYPARLRCKDGSVRDVLISSTVLWEEGRFMHTRSFTRDVTEHRRAEQNLRASETRYRTLTEAIPQLVWNATPDGRASYFNNRWRDYTGLTTEASQGWGWLDVIHPDDRGRVLADWQSTVQSARRDSDDRFSEEFRIRRGDTNEYRWFLSVVVPLRDATGGIDQWIGSMADIQDQKTAIADLKRIETELREREERFRTLLQTIPQIVWTANANGQVTFLNRRWEAFVGRQAGDELLENWLAVMPPAQAGEFRRHWLLAVARAAPEFSAEFQLRRGSDGLYRWMLATAISLVDSSGAVVEWVGSIADIDDQKRQAENLEQMVRERTTALLEEVEERKRVEQQLRAVGTELSRSNQELEQFAYVASHDLQEPLRKIQAFGDRLQTRFSDVLPVAGKEYVERMQISASRMRRLIDDLLTFSRVTTQARPFAHINLEKLVNEVVSDLEESLNQKGARIECRNLPTLEADPTQMRQLFQNLIANAIKFHRANTPPVIIVEAEVILSRFPNTNGPAIPACRIHVRDNGIGFNEKYLDRIFQVFQRLHGRDEYEGTGVGLAICRKIAERHGGTITARSQPGEGSTFIITLPLQHAKDEHASHDRTEQETDHHPDGGR